MPATATIHVASNAAQIVTIATTLPPPPPLPPPTRAQRISRVLFYGAAGVAVAGVGFHLLSAQQRGDLDDAIAADDPVAWDHHSGTFTAERDIAIGCYGVAARAIAAGIYMLVTDHGHDHERDGVTVTGSVGASAATVGVEWRR